MPAERAILYTLKQDATLQNYVGTSPVRVYPMLLPQTRTLPCILVRSQGIEPNHTKDGPSDLDIERVQVLLYVNDFTGTAFTIEERIRTLLDRALTGNINGVTVESCSFEDRDTFSEQIVDHDVFVIEHIYKVLVTR